MPKFWYELLKQNFDYMGFTLFSSEVLFTLRNTILKKIVLICFLYTVVLPDKTVLSIILSNIEEIFKT